MATKLPDLSAEDASEILEQMMQAHVSHKRLSATLVARAIERYLEELDPMKCYFLKEELVAWQELRPEELEAIQEQISQGDFTLFHTIHTQFCKAITRRQKLDERIAQLPRPTDINVSEFKEMQWAEDEEALTLRLQRVKAFQFEAAEKLDEALQKTALLRIEKRQKMHEEEVLGTSEIERRSFVLTHMLKAIASSFDAHTTYFTPHEASQFMIQVQQRLFGIGAQLRDDLNGFKILKIIEGGPAFKNANLKVGDRIIAIDYEPVVGLEISDAVDLIRGPENTSILMTILRDVGGVEEKHDIEITRGEVVIQEARMESELIPFADGVIARLALHAFYQDPQRSSAADLSEAISEIKREHKLKGIILDLRRNSGGMLPQAVAVAGLFITKGIVVSIQDNQGRLEHLRNIDGRMTYNGPLVILTSKASASASEIVSQTLQDYGRALVVGDPHTYGKGSFQTFTYDGCRAPEINPKGEFKVTRGRYYTVSGKSPQLVGVTPDLIVPGTLSASEIGERYSKYPLETDQITAHFDDQLEDIPPRQREQISWLYRLNLQEPMTTYTKHFETLKANSSARIEKSKFYQKMLTELEKQEECDFDFIKAAHEADVQLREAVCILQDLIVLLE